MQVEKPRFRFSNIELTEEQFFALRKYLPYRIRTRVMQAIVSDLIEELQKDASGFISGILLRDVKIDDFVRKG